MTVAKAIDVGPEAEVLIVEMRRSSFPSNKNPEERWPSLGLVPRSGSKLRLKGSKLLIGRQTKGCHQKMGSRVEYSL